MLTLDVFSDVVCPFCFIGRRKLAQALADEAAGAIEVRWRAFQLNPELPPEGVLCSFRGRFSALGGTASNLGS